jgi:hypothetical protein
MSDEDGEEKIEELKVSYVALDGIIGFFWGGEEELCIVGFGRSGNATHKKKREQEYSLLYLSCNEK